MILGARNEYTVEIKFNGIFKLDSRYVSLFMCWKRLILAYNVLFIFSTRDKMYRLHEIFSERQGQYEKGSYWEIWKSTLIQQFRSGIKTRVDLAKD